MHSTLNSYNNAFFIFLSLSRSAGSTMRMQMRRAFFPLICKQSTHTESVYVHDLWRFNVSITDIRQYEIVYVHAAVISSRACVVDFAFFATHFGRSCDTATSGRLLVFGRTNISLYNYRDAKPSPTECILLQETSN